MERCRATLSQTMKTTLLSLLLLIAPGTAGFVRAQEEKSPGAPREERKPEPGPDRAGAEMREFHQKMEQKMKAVMEEAGKLEAEGKKDEAEARRREAKERMKHEIEAHRREMQARREKDGPPRDGDRRPDGPPRGDMEAKLKHVEQAIAHLREAGMMDQAENLARMAERMRNAGRGPAGDQPRRDDRRPDGDIEALRRDIQELREAVRQLNERQQK